jgi:hypothetical protein
VNWHPTEDELILHYYGEAPTDIRSATDAHLAACSSCTEAWRELNTVLGAVTAVPVPEPDEGFERVMWARISRELPPRRTGWFHGRLAVVGALAAALVAVIAGTMAWITLATRQSVAPPSAVADGSDDTGGTDAQERVLLTALSEHLSQTEILLVEVMNAHPAAAEPDAWSFQRTTADDLVASGRLYRQTARQTGELQVANMLEDLEGVLVEVATAPEAVDRRNVDFLRARIEDDALLFKVRAVASDIRGRQTRLTYSE